MEPLRLQPIPYQGSKRALAPRICRIFPCRIQTLYEPFAGSAAISLYASHHDLAQSFVIGDVYDELIELWRLIIDEPQRVAAGYEALWLDQFSFGGNHFNDVRTRFNACRDPVLLLYLITRCVKNAVRFNKKGDFTQSVDKRRHGVKPDRMSATVEAVSHLLKGRTQLFKGDFRDCIRAAGPNDLVYMDPPYQGTTYGRDKRYAAQLDRERLVEVLEWLNVNNVPFILSYDGSSGEKEYGEPLPDRLNVAHLKLRAGRSSQATLMGRAAETTESLYVSGTIKIAAGDGEFYHSSVLRRSSPATI